MLFQPQYLGGGVIDSSQKSLKGNPYCAGSGNAEVLESIPTYDGTVISFGQLKHIFGIAYDRSILGFLSPG
jgi:hypothetical protein